MAVLVYHGLLKVAGGVGAGILITLVGAWVERRMRRYGYMRLATLTFLSVSLVLLAGYLVLIWHV